MGNYHRSCLIRRRFVTVIFLLLAMALVGRVVQLQYAEREFLLAQGDSRQQRTVEIPAHRGILTDRNGELLAISTPVGSVWADPARLLAARAEWGDLPEQLSLSESKLAQMLTERQNRKFFYLRRHLLPAEAEKISSRNIPGLHLRMEYRRYYPIGEAAAQLIGITDIDDQGQEGLELMFDAQLRGQPGARRVRQDSNGRIIDDLAQLRAPKHGENLRLSIERGLQYFAYRTLESAVRKHRARNGSVVVLDVVTGEVLTMAQAPSFNPNARRRDSAELRRNRAMTDQYEPGSIVKPFTVLAGLQSGRYTKDSLFETSPGTMRLDNSPYIIEDTKDLGTLDLTDVLVRSSNIASAKIALGLPAEHLWKVFSSVGFGQPLFTNYPGEATGVLRESSTWQPTDQASLGYGYGLSVTPMHLAQAFTILGNRGVHHIPSFLAQPSTSGTRVLPPEICDQVLEMLEQVTQSGGTATRAQVPGYTVAAKTGTVRRHSAKDGYSSSSHIAIIAGVVPRRHPRLAILVLVDDPRAGVYFGGLVAAPLFRRIAWEALRLLNIPPDDPQGLRQASMGGSG